MNLTRASVRLVCMGAMLAEALVGGSLMPGTASAHYAFCRSDPVVSLLNLGQLDVSASISDSESDVQKVVYVVHAPVGTKLLAVINTDSLIGLHEQVQFVADDPANTFDVYTTVYTGQSGVAVTATSALVSLLNLNLGLASVPGLSGHTIHTHFASLLK